MDRKGIWAVLTVVICALLVIAGIIYIFKSLRKGSCGDGRCDDEESCDSCMDCACMREESCSSGRCVKAEDIVMCGDGKCARGESCSNCLADCPCEGVCDRGICTTARSECGDSLCNAGESCASCPQDCLCSPGTACDSRLGKCLKTSSCGNRLCDGNDDCSNCPQDCPCEMDTYCNTAKLECIKPICGNGVCETYENQDSCCEDCPCFAKYMICTDHLCKYPPAGIADDEAERIAIEYLASRELTVKRTVSITDFVWEGSPSKKIVFDTLEQGAPCVVVVKENREVKVLVTY
jgi:hypothetical protein